MIEMMKITDELPKIKYPLIIKSFGTAPKQYKQLNMAKEYNMVESVININIPEIDKILQYPEPDYFTLNEKVYNQEVLQVLTRLDPTIPNYTNIKDCFDADSITALKKLKKHYGKDGHIVNYSKKVNKAKKGRYLPKSVRTSLTDAQKRATNRKKKEASKKGSQYAKYSKSIAKKVRMA